jgi:pyruvate kinase
MRRTKIISTLGPASSSEEMLRRLLQAGVNAVRLNFSHGTHEEHRRTLETFKKVRAELGLFTASILDTKGPEIRIKAFEGGRAELVRGQMFTITTEDVSGTSARVSVTYPNLHKELKPGDRVLIDDGLIELVVREISGRDVRCEVLNGGELRDNKGMNIPGVHIHISALSERDINDLRFAAENGMDFVAASFIRSRADVEEVRRALNAFGGEKIRIIAKIENREGVDNIPDILEAADAVMVARGDLGVEIPPYEVPIIQKRIVSDCVAAGKPVIVATQMLDSMIRNPRPTRAEVSDVANAVYDGAGCVMLSGETAVGKYPIESVKIMAETLLAAERSIDYWERFRTRGLSRHCSSIDDAISSACCTTAMELCAAAIVTVTNSGHTARMIARFRPACPIIALSEHEIVCRQLSLSWGVEPRACERLDSTDALFDAGLHAALESGFVKKGDTVVLTAGVPIGLSGSTNLVKAQVVP